MSKFVKKKGRALPVFLLIDTSGSMHGEKIGTVNQALKEMLANFRKIEDAKGIIQLCILTFGNNQISIIKGLSEVSDSDNYNLQAEGNTPMGHALEYITDVIDDPEIVPSTSYTPTIILISDGNPTDFDADGLSVPEICEWDKMKKLHTSQRASKAVRIAMGIGNDMNRNLLKAFINNDSIPVIMAKDNNTISRFFEWVTMSVSVRSVSYDPQNPIFADIDDYIDDDERY